MKRSVALAVRSGRVPEFVVLEHLGVPQRDRRAGGPSHPDAYPPDEVLPEIDQGLAGRGGPDLDGSKLFLPADGRTDVRSQRAEVKSAGCTPVQASSEKPRSNQASE